MAQVPPYEMRTMGDHRYISGHPEPDPAFLLHEQRRNALAEMDAAPFSWFHVRVAFVAGAGFFTDAYDLFAINMASILLGDVYGPDQKLTPSQDLWIKTAASVGALFGQVIFGLLSDIIGRKRMYGVELVIIIGATFCQALAGSGRAINIITALIVWRFIMGLGIGGDYPLSAVIPSEFSATRLRGRLMTAVFAAQGGGYLTASLVCLLLAIIYKQRIEADRGNIDYMWRFLIGLGCVPGVIALYFRLTIPETPRFTMDIERNIKQAAYDIQEATGNFTVDLDVIVNQVQAPQASLRDFASYFSQRQNGLALFACAYSWFALDISYYGLGLNSGDIQLVLFPTWGALDIYSNVRNISAANIFLACGGLIPGFWVTFLFIDVWGRKPIQLLGFCTLTVIFLIMGFAYDSLIENSASRKVFVFLYCMANFFHNFGPNTTTFIIPGELFPTRYRSTAHGIAAASGKLGAIISQVVFYQLKTTNQNHQVIRTVLKIFAFVMLSGAGATALLPETKGKSLEELAEKTRNEERVEPFRAHRVPDGAR